MTLQVRSIEVEAGAPAQLPPRWTAAQEDLERSSREARGRKSRTYTPDLIAYVLRTTPDTMFVTISRRGSAKINILAIEALFTDTTALGWLPCDPQENDSNFHGQAQVDAEPQ